MHQQINKTAERFKKTALYRFCGCPKYAQHCLSRGIVLRQLLTIDFALIDKRFGMISFTVYHTEGMYLVAGLEVIWL